MVKSRSLPSVELFFVPFATPPSVWKVGESLGEEISAARWFCERRDEQRIGSLRSHTNHQWFFGVSINSGTQSGCLIVPYFKKPPNGKITWRYSVFLWSYHGIGSIDEKSQSRFKWNTPFWWCQWCGFSLTKPWFRLVFDSRVMGFRAGVHKWYPKWAVISGMYFLNWGIPR